MNGLNLLSNIEFVRTHSGASSAQTSTGTVIDTANCEGVLFVASIGTASTATLADTTGLPMYISAGDTTSSTGHSQLEGTLVAVTTGATALTNKLLAVDVYRPTFGRYLSNTITITTGDVLDGAIAIKYGVRKGAVTQSTTYFQSTGSYAAVASPSTAS
jgi:hypothetical protein